MTVDNMSREPALVALFGLAIRLKTENRICHILPPYPLWNHFIGKEYGLFRRVKKQAHFPPKTVHTTKETKVTVSPSLAKRALDRRNNQCPVECICYLSILNQIS